MDPLAALTAGVSFNRKRFEGGAAKKRPAPAEPPAPAPASHLSGSQRKKARRSAAVESKDGSVDLLSGGDSARGKAGRAAASRSAAAAASSAALAQEAAAVLRKAHKIRLAGAEPGSQPAPLGSFAELGERYGAPPRLLQQLSAEGWTEPTPVQRQAIPCLIEGSELLCVAPTGSGKTLAFLLPILLSLLAPSPSVDAAGPRAVVVAPTRELATQTQRAFRRLAPPASAPRPPRCTVLTRAHLASGSDAFSRAELLVSTPARLAQALAPGADGGASQLSLGRCGWLVLDEADKLFDTDFLEQMDAILVAFPSNGPQKCTRSLFSATLPEKVEQLARSLLPHPIRLTVGARGGACSSVTQRLLFCGSEQGKLLAMRQLLRDGGLRPPAVVFVQSAERCAQLAGELRGEGVPLRAIHGGLSEAQRSKAVDAFRAGTAWLLIATDLLARGMDFVGVETVVNYDFPASATSYVHRVGRSGRAGRSGSAITFFTEADAPKLRTIANVVAASGGESSVPDWMLALPKEAGGGGGGGKAGSVPRRTPIESGSRFDREQARKKRSMVEASKRLKGEQAEL